jgi:hypothetical protein
VAVAQELNVHQVDQEVNQLNLVIQAHTVLEIMVEQVILLHLEIMVVEVVVVLVLLEQMVLDNQLQEALVV